MDFFWEMTSALVGSTVDTCLRQSTEAFVLLRAGRSRRWTRTLRSVLSARSHLPSLMKKWPRSSSTTVVWLVLLVTMHVALCSHFTLVFYSCRHAQDFRHRGLAPACGDPTSAGSWTNLTCSLCPPWSRQCRKLWSSARSSGPGCWLARCVQRKWWFGPGSESGGPSVAALLQGR